MQYQAATQKNYVRTIEAVLKEGHIKKALPGFYDHPHFVKAEKHGHIRLVDYAGYIRQRSYLSPYIQTAAATVEKFGIGIRNALVAEQSVGRCIDACKVLSKMLEAVGIWNYIVGGAVGIYHRSPEPRTPIRFYQYDLMPIEVGHAWIVAPPFGVVDVTLQLQPYRGLERQHIPAYLFMRDARAIQAGPSDVCSPALLRGLRLKGYSDAFIMQQGLAGYAKVAQDLQAVSVTVGELNIRYIPCKMITSEGGLDSIAPIRINAQTPRQLFAALND